MLENRRIRIAYLVTHPIQYQASLLRLVAAQPDLELTVFFASDFSARPFLDGELQTTVVWQEDILTGYKSRRLGHYGSDLRPGELPSFFRPLSRGIGRELRQGRFDALWIHGYHRFSHLWAMVVARYLGIPILLRDEVTAVSSERSRLRQTMKRFFFKLLDRWVDVWLVIGTANSDYYTALGIESAKMVLMPYTVDNDFFQTRHTASLAQNRPAWLRLELGIDSVTPVILFVGKLIARKRPLDVIRAMAAVAEPAVLVMGGEGGLRTECERLVTELRLSERVKLVGFRGQAELADYYAMASLFVLPSERESWGLVINEAMNAALPIVASDRCGAARDLVRPGKNGFGYRVGEVDRLGKILSLLLGNPLRRAAMGRQSLAMISGWGLPQSLSGLREGLRKVRLLDKPSP
ncbi:MAG: glycosyltransferase family 4 protein [Alphaproteobacteria bacterium]|nr:glycosyltransferase family 4 protein [Alphaproteobacteria bacterium]